MATVDGDEIPYRMLRPTIANEPDRERRRADRARAQRADRGAPPADPARRVARRAECGGTAGRAQLRGAASPVRLPPRRARRAVPHLPRRDRATVGGGRRSSLPRARRGRPRRRAALRRRPRLPGARVGPVVPRRRDAARARGDARRPRRSTCAPRRTSSSTSSSARRRHRARSAPRSRCRSASCS